MNWPIRRMRDPLQPPLTVPAWHLEGAWISLALFPVGILVGWVLGVAVLSTLGYSFGYGTPPSGVALAVGIPSVLVAIVPALLALVFGLRAWREGRQWGLLPALLGGGLAVAFILFNAHGYLATH